MSAEARETALMDCGCSAAGGSRAQSEGRTAVEPPNISVVVPTYNRDDLLIRCLAALISQDYPDARFEIIVVDDAVNPSTKRLVDSMVSIGRPVVRYLAVGGPIHGPAAARNLGWRAAAGEIIAFTDDDCIPGGDWLRQGASVVKNGEADAVCGRIIMPLPPNPTDYEKNESRLETGEFVTANCFCLKTALARVSGFDEKFTAAWREDSDLFFRMLDAGCAIQRHEKAVVLHPLRPAPWGISLRLQKKALFDALLYKKHPRHFRERVIPRPPWHYYLSVASALCGLALTWLGFAAAAAASGLLFGVVAVRFCLGRLRTTSKSPRHIAEMAVTSLAIPFLAVFWRLYGALKFRVLYF